MLEFFVDNFSPELAVLLVAAIPLFESKVAIPLGLSVQIWGAEALSVLSSFFLSLIGSMLPVVFVILIVRFIKNKTSGFVYDKFVVRIQEKYKTNLDKMSAKNTTLKKCVLLATFVAIPLPLTGVYSGSLIAGFTNLKIWQSFLAIFIGEIVSCLIILFLSTIVENSAFYILLISILIIVMFVLFNLFLGVINKIKKEKR